MPVQGHLNKIRLSWFPLYQQRSKVGFSCLNKGTLCYLRSLRIDSFWPLAAKWKGQEEALFHPAIPLSMCQMLKGIWNVSECLCLHNCVSSLVSKHSQESFSVNQIYLSTSGCAEYFYRFCWLLKSLPLH